MLWPRSFLFADVRGFSKLPERNMEVFVAAYLGALAEAIGCFAGDIDYRATAGDGISWSSAPRLARRNAPSPCSNSPSPSTMPVTELT